MGNHKDLSGLKFGKLTPIKFFICKNKRGINLGHWECKCDCGNVCNILASNLSSLRPSKSPRRTSCGKCRRNGYKYECWEEYLFSLYRYGAKKRNIKFNISYEFFKISIKQNCHYCNSSPNIGLKNKPALAKLNGGPIYYNGIDRKESDKGYEKSNCVPCCRICNQAKMSKSYNEWIDWIKRISIYSSSINFNYSSVSGTQSPAK